MSRLIQQMNALPRIRPLAPKKLERQIDLCGWIIELKYDGYRGLAYLENGTCRLVSKQGKRLAFPALEQALAKTLRKATNAVLDGEVCSLNDRGMSIFKNLCRRTGTIVYVAFDLLYLNGMDLRDKPLRERKRILTKLIGTPKATPILRAKEVHSNISQFFSLVIQEDLEGIVIKHKDSLYRPPSSRWYKILNPTYSQDEHKRRVFKR